MAVTGEIGDQSVTLNNAATEATLQQLVAAVGVLASKTNNAYKSAQNFEKDIKRFQKEMNKAAQSGNKLKNQANRQTRAFEESTDAIEDEAAARKTHTPVSVNSQMLHRQ